MSRAGGGHDARLGQMCPQRVDRLCSLTNQKVAGPLSHRRRHFPGLSVQFHEGELGGAVPSRAFSMPCQAMDGDEEVKFAFSRLNLSNINVEVAERVGLELLLRGLVAVNLGEARDVMALQTTVQR